MPTLRDAIGDQAGIVLGVQSYSPLLPGQLQLDALRSILVNEWPWRAWGDVHC